MILRVMRLGEPIAGKRLQSEVKTRVLWNIVAWQSATARFLSVRPLWICFLVPLCVQLFLLTLLALAPHAPFSILLAPPIRFFVSDRVLHYPDHLLWLYHVMPSLHAVSMLLVGAPLSGVAARIVGQIQAGAQVSLRNACRRASRFLWHCTFAWSATWIVRTLVARLLSRWVTPGPFAPVLLIAAMVLLQAFVVYAIPAAALSEVSWLSALGRSIRFAVLHPLQTAGVVALPLLLVLLIFGPLSEPRVAQWMRRFEPEIVLLPMMARLAVLTVADAIMTIGAAQVWNKTFSGRGSFLHA